MPSESPTPHEPSQGFAAPFGAELVRVMGAPGERWVPALRVLYAELLAVLVRFDPEVDPSTQLQSDWWQRPDELFAYLLLVNGEPAGFGLVLTGAYVPAVGAEGDAALWEFFIADAHRGTGLAQASLNEIVRRHPGVWSVQTRPANERALRFWRGCLLGPPLQGTEQPSSEATAGFTRFTFHST